MNLHCFLTADFRCRGPSRAPRENASNKARSWRETHVFWASGSPCNRIWVRLGTLKHTFGRLGTHATASGFAWERSNALTQISRATSLVVWEPIKPHRGTRANRSAASRLWPSEIPMEITHATASGFVWEPIKPRLGTQTHHISPRSSVCTSP